jgi:hypothetical protein
MDNYEKTTEELMADLVMEKREIAERWEKYNLLSKVESDEWEQLDLAVLLENQRLHNANNDYDAAAFKRVSIPMVMRLWNGLIARKVVSFQPMFEDEGLYFYLDYEDGKPVMKHDKMVCRSFKNKAAWSPEATQDLRSHYNLDAEAELTAILTQEMALELDRRIMTNLRNNCGTVATWDFNDALGDTIMEKFEALYLKCREVSEKMSEKTGRSGANWIITSPEIASMFETVCRIPDENPIDFTNSLGITRVGTIYNRWTLYKDPLFPVGSMLFGYKGNTNYDAGYVYSPRLLAGTTPVVLDPNSFVPRKNLMTVEGHKLIDKNFYAKMNITNFIS